MNDTVGSNFRNSKKELKETTDALSKSLILQFQKENTAIISDILPKIQKIDQRQLKLE